MRFQLLSADFAVLLLLLLAVLRPPDSFAQDACPPENCLSAEKCDEPWKGGVCKDKEGICCSLVKSEHKTHCHHHGGECMSRCNKDLQRNVVDCPDDKICCVLV